MIYLNKKIMGLLTTDEIKKLGEKRWEGCHGCNENDKYFWMNGFVMGYLEARVEYLDDKIKTYREKIGDMLIKSIDNL
jgi:hypothetical protein